ncbi:uncharacterized protein LOC123548516 [Mercenaria mercenaria]|uniref:uncharacterized protein LOC123548516 n=1 Tax=Mercenaria mercenaria TaxID=6596 RepID=UPI00234EAF19|nr:uncharacterized protein LOC123548516 [Mercenaria mercenaria]
MSRPYSDIMTVSVTVNVCVFLFNVVPRLRTQVLATPALRKYKTIITVCGHYAETPLDLARILTNQLLLWILVLCSLLAICASDVIRYPFHSEVSSNWQTIFVETLFAVNIGRYMFIVTEKFLFKRTTSKVQFRADIVHHFVTVLCYILFLAYGQNLLLGLVGILIESTSIFDEIGRFCKDRERRHTLFYKRLVVVNCVGVICFRGVIPTVFLVIAMFQQSPFTMHYAPLMLFFLSIIFFSVINVWQILSSIQRLMKRIYEKSHELPTTEPDVGQSQGTLVRHTTRRPSRIKLAKNNLGYLRPYENKNIASYSDEKYNLNNRKEFAKETVCLHVNPEMFFTTNKLKGFSTNLDGTNIVLEDQTLQTETGETGNLEHLNRAPTVLFYSGRRPLRESSSTNDSSQSDTVLISLSERNSGNSAVHTSLNNVHERLQSDDLDTLALEPRLNAVRSNSTGNIVDSCGAITATNPV